MTRLVLSGLFVTNMLLFEHQQKNCSLADSCLDGYGVTKYGSGWMKDVVNQCLEFVTCVEPLIPPSSSDTKWRVLSPSFSFPLQTQSDVCWPPPSSSDTKWRVLKLWIRLFCCCLSHDEICSVQADINRPDYQADITGMVDWAYNTKLPTYWHHPSPFIGCQMSTN